MKRDIFDETLTDGKSAKDEFYEPGVARENTFPLAEEIMEHYFEQKLWTTIGWHERFNEQFKEKLGEVDNLDPELFLNDIVLSLSSSNNMRLINRSGFLLDSIIQGLYELGHDIISVDLSALPCNVDRLFEDLKAEKDKPLLLHCKHSPGIEYNSTDFGYDAENVLIHFTGKLFAAASNAKNSTYYFNDTVTVIGNHAKDCEFYFNNVIGYEIEKGAHWHGSIKYDLKLQYEGKSHTTSFMDFFFTFGNKIFIGKDGEWTKVLEPEVTP